MKDRRSFKAKDQKSKNGFEDRQEGDGASRMRTDLLRADWPTPASSALQPPSLEVMKARVGASKAGKASLWLKDVSGRNKFQTTVKNLPQDSLQPDGGRSKLDPKTPHTICA